MNNRIYTVADSGHRLAGIRGGMGHRSRMLQVFSESFQVDYGLTSDTWEQ